MGGLRSSVAEASDDQNDLEIGYLAVVEAFREVAEAITDETERDDLLHMIARKICALLGIRRCSVYLKEPEGPLFRGQVAETGSDDDQRIKRLTAGTEADAFTREIVATRRPVLISDAQQDPRPVRATMRAWNVRSMLGVPMVIRQSVIGILFLDNASEPHHYSAAQQSVAATFANLAAVAISQTTASAELRRTVRTVARQNDLLRRASAMDDQLADVALEGATLEGIARSLAQILDKPCAIHDARFAPLAVAQPPGREGPVPRILDPESRSIPAVAEALEGLRPRRASMVGPLHFAGLQHRFLITPVVVRGEQWGYLVVMEFGSKFTALDVAAANRAGTMVALEMAASRRVADAQAYSRDCFVRDLLAGREPDAALIRRGAPHGVDLRKPHVVAVLRAPLAADKRCSLASVEEACAGIGTAIGKCLAVIDGDIVMIVEAGDSTEALEQARNVVDKVMERLSGDSAVHAGISSPCRHPDEYGRGFDEARQVVSCVERVRGTDASGSLSAAELGAGRLFLSMADRAEIARYANDTLGPILDGSERSEEMLQTLNVFFLSGRNVRDASQRLGVHENTIRYRLGRLTELTHLDVMTDVEDQLAVHISLLILRLERRLPGLLADDALAVSSGTEDEH